MLEAGSAVGHEGSGRARVLSAPCFTHAQQSSSSEKLTMPRLHESGPGDGDVSGGGGGGLERASRLSRAVSSEARPSATSSSGAPSAMPSEPPNGGASTPHGAHELDRHAELVASTI